MTRRLLPAALLLAFVISIHAAPPPELTALQQQYAFALTERVTGPYDTGIEALNAKFLTALTNAATEAKKAGNLPAMLAIEEDKKLIADKQPLPEADDDKTPESLKKLRGIYRAASAKLTEQRSAAHAALLPAYTAKLQTLESTLTKTDRLEEAKEVLKYRESVGTDLPPPAVAAATVSQPPAATTKSEDKAPKVKGDDRKAAEWVLSLGNKHRIIAADKKVIKTLSDIPKGKFSIGQIEIDGRYLDAPVNGETIRVLAGLQDLARLHVHHVPLGDADFGFLATLSGLTALEMIDNSVTDGVVQHLMTCKALEDLKIADNKAFTGATLGQLTALKNLKSFTAFKTSFNDAGVAQLAQFKELNFVMFEGHKEVTDACLPHLKLLTKCETLFICGTGITPKGLGAVKMPNIKSLSFNKLSEIPMRESAPVVAPAFPNVIRINISFDVGSPEDIAALAHFPKLDLLINYGTIKPEALDGLASLPKLNKISYDFGTRMNDEGLRHVASSKSLETIRLNDCDITDVGLMQLTGMKKLKLIQLKSSAVTDAGLAAFKKERPDVKVEK